MSPEGAREGGCPPFPSCLGAGAGPCGVKGRSPCRCEAPELRSPEARRFSPLCGGCVSRCHWRCVGQSRCFVESVIDLLVFGRGFYRQFSEYSLRELIVNNDVVILEL